MELGLCSYLRQGHCPLHKSLLVELTELSVQIDCRLRVKKLNFQLKPTGHLLSAD